MSIANVRYEGRLVIAERPGEGDWTMAAPLVCTWSEGAEQHRIVVPVGFDHDLASVPRVFRSLVPVIGKWNKAAVIHDWCYEKRWRSREAADALFLAGLKASGVGWLTRNAMYAAVRLGGGRAWAT